jgi:hypothetical protein
VMLTAKLCRSFLAALDLAAQVKFELPCESARGLGGHNLLRSGSVPAGVDSTQWYGQRGSLQVYAATLYCPTESMLMAALVSLSRLRPHIGQSCCLWESDFLAMCPHPLHV